MPMEPGLVRARLLRASGRDQEAWDDERAWAEEVVRCEAHKWLTYDGQTQGHAEANGSTVDLVGWFEVLEALSQGKMNRFTQRKDSS